MFEEREMFKVSFISVRAGFGRESMQGDSKDFWDG